MYTDILQPLCFFGFGVWGFFWGFSRLRRKRLIENIPTSTIRGLAIGLAEIVGDAKKDKPLKGPFSNADCVFYSYTVERYEQSGRSSKWVTIAKGDSSYCPFLLNDGTGEIMVFPKGAETFLSLDYEFGTGWEKPLPSNLVEFMNRNSIAYRDLFGTHKLRFKEYHIYPGDKAYILGTARNVSSHMNDHREKLRERLVKLKKDPKGMAEIDLNKDGNISPEEWDLAVAKIETEILEEELKSSEVTTSSPEIIIAKGEAEKIFILSDYSQKDLIGKLLWQSILGIYGGAALAMVMLLNVAYHLVILRF
ncbi:MAG: hypothetical protein COS99_07425 [Candidatus Omnitrophica bacterium CG07_land_8_20_14_0_80_42_15]|uniref:EF-hand domain-containing protein n=1 Tax=Candidatus Aquitaenariimonas noxiae TaxID=1974741 RepID=A0A2J0KRD6_9BACT|nr:MAG: hypothetical protein COS99_07425 [Candidatus Omnitrophica bacterium CG07_land_8_20_14_0_80_42_15]